MPRCLAYLTVLLMAALLLAAPLRAADLGPLIANLAEGGFKDTARAVDELAATGDPDAVPVLSALLEGALYQRKSDKKIFRAEKVGRELQLFDPITGAPVDIVGKRAAEKIKVNNRLRKQIRGALGTLTLVSPDPDQRRSGADAVFKTPAPENAPLLRAAIAKETDEAVQRRMQRALAAVTLRHDSDPAARIAAVKTLGSFTDQEVRGVLSALLLTDQDGSPLEADAQLRAAAATALAEVESRLEFWAIAESIFHGLSLGSVLLLAAIGLAITFGVMGVINMAHGEMVMLGAYTTFIIQEIIRATNPGLFDYSLFIAVPAAFLVAGAVGVGIERGVIRFLYGRPLETLLATWGLSLILQQTVRSIFGPTNKEVGTPSWMSGALEFDSGLVLTYNRLAIIFFALAVLAILMLLLRYTAFGLRMRAVTQNRGMASAMGIRTGQIDALTFGLGSGIAGMAGVALSQIDNVSPNLGQAYIVDSFMVVVFGGVGNLWGTFFGGMSLGLVNKFLEPYAGAVLGKIIVLVAIILFIQRRPRGLFALKGRAVEN